MGVAKQILTAVAFLLIGTCGSLGLAGGVAQSNGGLLSRDQVGIAVLMGLMFACLFYSLERWRAGRGWKAAFLVLAVGCIAVALAMCLRSLLGGSALGR